VLVLHLMIRLQLLEPKRTLGEHRELHLGCESRLEFVHDSLTRDLLLLVVVRDLGVLGDDGWVSLAVHHGVRDQIPILQFLDLQRRLAAEWCGVPLRIKGRTPALAPLNVGSLGRSLSRMIRQSVRFDVCAASRLARTGLVR